MQLSRNFPVRISLRKGFQRAINLRLWSSWCLCKEILDEHQLKFNQAEIMPMLRISVKTLRTSQTTIKRVWDFWKETAISSQTPLGLWRANLGKEESSSSPQSRRSNKRSKQSHLEMLEKKRSRPCRRKDHNSNSYVCSSREFSRIKTGCKRAVQPFRANLPRHSI